jgi:hypothetical protein
VTNLAVSQHLVKPVVDFKDSLGDFAETEKNEDKQPKERGRVPARLKMALRLPAIDGAVVNR